MMQTKDKERFLAKIVERSDTGCHEWTGAKNRDGYGNFMLSRKTISSHRMAWIIANGQIQQGMSVLHKCDNPACCNPDHLFLGTQIDNIRDRHNKGRSNAPRGEQSGAAKLTDQQVRDIRALHSTGNHSYRKLAKRFNVHFSHIGYIVRNQVRKTK